MAKLAEEILLMVKDLLMNSVWSSASPGFSNTVKEMNSISLPNLEESLEDTKNIEDTKSKKKQKKVEKTIEGWEKGNVGKVQRFTTQQFSNLQDFVDGPVDFIIQNVFRKFAKGAGIIAFALIIFEAVKWIISELLKPGRLLDTRFKRDINKEIIAFRQREDQQRIKQGFSNIIITTTPRLRGGAGQITNTLNMAAGRQQFPDNIGQSPILLEASGVSMSKAKGRRTFSRR